MSPATPVFALDPSSSNRSLVVYVGERAQKNLQIGLNSGIWGFKDPQPEYEEVSAGDWVLLGTGYQGGSVRVPLKEWQEHKLGSLHVARATTGILQDRTPVWPDENGTRSYPYRVRFDVVQRVNDVPLSDETLSRQVSDSLRRSAIAQGRGYLVPLGGSLFGQDDAMNTTRVVAEVFEQVLALQHEWQGHNSPRNAKACGANQPGR